ncbi:Holliday junction DNA helicase RuvA [Salirhabdus euzebyi]|uniref:Holliday junction branch migration complex subunit RuvA n=1 Tax=Salirhabdus euzebyi TaxID=394506 RepID=A0A841PSY5_9BACI|nr:Holliday junction branch migration protein RuvA [Salirhabdus euzebyi]MBB6451900.1 Holliday junction DNA helicase RuvA [Salirhabdus euzebyi]
MFAFIEGQVDSVDINNVVIVVNGIGYEIVCANPYQFQHNIDEKIRVYTYHYVREDQQLLYGFKKKEEKHLFAKLLNVSGIGPKSALSIVATSGVTEIANAIEQEDEKYLTQFPGVGKKTARQMILDLKGKVSDWIGIDKGSNSDTDNPQNQGGLKERLEQLNEAMEALKSLGYSEREVQRIIPMLKKENFESVDDYIRKGLSLMMEQR